MRRARRLYLKARHVVSRLSADARRRWHSGDDAIVELETVKRRLELLLTALYGSAPRIEAAGSPRTAGLGDGTVRFSGRHRSDDVLAANDGESIRLPPFVEAPDAATAIARYRLLEREVTDPLAASLLHIIILELEADLHSSDKSRQ